MLVIPVHPIPGESLAGLVARASAVNHYRAVHNVLSQAGITLAKAGSVVSQPREHAGALADTLGTKSVDAVAGMFHTSVDGPAGWVDFFGVPLRSMYLETSKRRVSPRALSISPHARAIWNLRVFSFDPETMEALIDTCPGCGRHLGWTRTPGICFCDKCVRTENVGEHEFEYPSVDLRQFPQPIVEVEDVEALRFVTNLVNPVPECRSRAANLIPACWSHVPVSGLFELAMCIASALGTTNWRLQAGITRRTNRSAEITPHNLARAGRAIIGGVDGFLALLHSEFAKRPGMQNLSRKELGPLTAVCWDSSLLPEVKSLLRPATDEAVKRAINTYGLPIRALAKMFRLPLRVLSRLATSGLVPVLRVDGWIHGPARMAVSVIEALMPQYKDAVAEPIAAAALGVHSSYLDELSVRGLIMKISGPVLGMLEGAVYYSRRSIDELNACIFKAAQPGSPPADAMSLPKAFAACDIRPVPWTDVTQAIIERKIRIFASPEKKYTLSRRIWTNDFQTLRTLFASPTSNLPLQALAHWIGNSTVAEILGIHQVAVWRLEKEGKLTRHNRSSTPFERVAVEAYAKQVVFIPEIRRMVAATSHRAAVKWLADRDIEPLYSLGRGKWHVYDRHEVMQAVSRSLANRSSSARLADLNSQALHQGWIDRKQAAKIIGISERAVQILANLGVIATYGEVCAFSKNDAELYARSFIFEREIGRRIGLKNKRGVLRWLSRHNIQPVSEITAGATIRVYSREAVEAVIPEKIASNKTGKTYSEDRRRKVITLVARGVSINKAALKAGVAESTAKRWVRRWRVEGSLPVKRKSKTQVEPHVDVLRKIVAANSQSSIHGIVLALRAETGVLASEPGIRKCIARNNIPWKQGLPA